MAGNYAVLGGGVLGLTAGLRLAQRGDRVTVFEREALPGGLAAGFPIPEAPDPSGEGVWLEKYYHHLFKSDRSIIALVHELGLGDALEWRRPLTVTLRGGQPYQLDSPASVMRFSPMPTPSRLRMGLVLAYLRLLPSPGLLEGNFAAAWLRRTMGRHAYDSVWGPLLKGKFGGLADEIALPWFWARVHDRTAELGYVRGGFQRFYNRLAQRVRDVGGTIRLSTQVHTVERDDRGLSIAYSTGGGPRAIGVFDRVVSTLPTRLTCRLIPQLPEEYRTRYDWGQAYGAHCLILALDRPLTRSYWMNVNDPGYPFMVLVEHTNYVPPEEYGGRHLIYLGNYRPMDDPLFGADKDAVMSEFLPHLRRINGTFDPAWIADSWMFSAPFAQPIVTTEYRDHIPPFATPIPGLYVANMFQVYPHDRGQNFSVELAERLVRHLSAH